MRYKNLTLIGTSHIAKQSIEDVKQTIDKNKPAIVAVELDANRYYSLKNTKKAKLRLKDIFHIGVIGFLFALLGKWAQQKLGRIVGVMPGAEMLTAIKAARRNKADIRLIDQDITLTLKRLSKAITFREELRFLLDILKAAFFRKREIKRLGLEDFDLAKVPSREIIKKLIMEFKKSYPNAYRVLVSERNNVMAARLARIIGENKAKKIVAVVGAGHEEDIVRLIKKHENREKNSKKITYSFSISS